MMFVYGSLCHILFRCGLKRKQLRELLGLDVALQRRVSKRHPRRGKNGRKGYCKLNVSATKRYLDEHSNLTCSLWLGRGKRKAGEVPEVVHKRALTDSRRQLFLKLPKVVGTGGTEKRVCCHKTWYRTVKAKLPEYSGCARVLDKCGKCHDWDEPEPLHV